MSKQVVITYEDIYGGCQCSRDIEILAICAEEDVDACIEHLLERRPYMDREYIDVERHILNFGVEE